MIIYCEYEKRLRKLRDAFEELHDDIVNDRDDNDENEDFYAELDELEYIINDIVSQLK